jgi:hypothetical protein
MPRILRNIGKGLARAMTADVLGMPVDTLNMIRGGLLGPAQAGNPSARALGGLLGPVQQTGSGDWFAQQMGLPQGQGMAYEAARMISPSPTDVMGLVRRAPIQEIMTYHGTPHRFEPTPENPLGEFRASQIGTGEGAQAYGHGLYLAESPKVADTYRKNLQGGPIGIKIMEAAQKALGTRYDEAASSSQFIDGVRAVAGQGADAVRDAIVKTAKRMAASQWPGDKRLADRVRALADNPAVVKAVNEEAAGSLYTADLPDEMVDRMLDWDKPLSEQSPSVLAALEKSKNKQIRAILEYAKTPYTGAGIEGETKTMGEAYRVMSMSLSGRANAASSKASKLLQEAGIPGIKYLDAGSRGDKAKPTRNFVVFPGEEKKVKILKRE